MDASFLLFTLYKMAGIGAGVFLGYLGYRLFTKGVWGSAGDLTANSGNNQLLLKSAAPGTFFVVLGAVVILSAIWQGFGTEVGEYGLETTETGDGFNQLEVPALPD